LNGTNTRGDFVTLNDPADDGPRTLRLIPLGDVMEFVQKVKSMRKAQKRFFTAAGRDKPERRNEAMDWERRVDEAVAALVSTYNETPALFGSDT